MCSLFGYFRVVPTPFPAAPPGKNNDQGHSVPSGQGQQRTKSQTAKPPADPVTLVFGRPNIGEYLGKTFSMVTAASTHSSSRGGTAAVASVEAGLLGNGHNDGHDHRGEGSKGGRQRSAEVRSRGHSSVRVRSAARLQRPMHPKKSKPRFCP